MQMKSLLLPLLLWVLLALCSYLCCSGYHLLSVDAFVAVGIACFVFVLEVMQCPRLSEV